MQFLRFAMVGFLNTLIDFGVLNGLLWWDGYPVGWRLFVYNALAFSIASTNSYLINKRWTFGDSRPASLSQAGLFFFLTSIGLFINCTVVYLFTFSEWSPLAVSPAIWVNIAKVAATFASLAWNYCSYRWWVFPSSSAHQAKYSVTVKSPITLQ